MALIDGVLAGEARAAGRAMSLVEDGVGEASAVLRGLAPHTGRAHLVGFTGPPGVGKSSLLAALGQAARRRGLSLGIVAADPTSSFTGGALLGDRIRMRSLFEDPHVFIRSMATRHHAGSLPPAARDVCRILDAMGKDLILLETVGAGQGEVCVLRYVDTVVLVLSPGAGDYIQAMKAGSMEIADVIAVNKSDLAGAAEAAADLSAFLQVRAATAALRPAGERLRSPHAQTGTPSKCASEDAHSSLHGSGETCNAAWSVPVVPTATVGRGEGVEALLAAIERHGAWLRESGQLDARRRRHLAQEVADYCLERVASGVAADPRLERYVEEVSGGRLTSFEAGCRLAQDLLDSASSSPSGFSDES